MRGSKIPVQELWLKWEGGVFARGGVIAGFYGIHMAIPYRTAKLKSADAFAMAIWDPTAI